MDIERFHKDATGRAGMILCIGGSRKILINGQLYEVGRGMLCFLSPIISICELSREKDYQEVSIIEEASVFYQVVRGVLDIILKYSLRDTPCLQLNEEYIKMFVERQANIASKKEYVLSLPDTGERTLVMRSMQLLEQQTMLEFIHLYYLGHSVSPKSTSKNESILLQFIYTVHTSPNHERSVAFYANNAGLSPNHFTRIIREQTGKTPSEWIALIITVKAKTLLKQSDMNIKGVAAKLNFPEQYTFRKFFKLHVGMSPKEYKQQVHRTKD